MFNFQPRLYLGAIIEYAISIDSIEGVPDDSYDVFETNYVTQAFQTAATLDADYQVLADIWEKGKSKSLKAHKRGGVDMVEASRIGGPRLTKLEARCRVPVTVARQMAQEAGASTASWVEGVAGTLLLSVDGND